MTVPPVVVLELEAAVVEAELVVLRAGKRKKKISSQETFREVGPGMMTHAVVLAAASVLVATAEVEP